MTEPLTYDQLNQLYTAVSPSSVHCKNTMLTNYFQRLLFQRVLNVFKISGPEMWDMDYFRTVLFGVGYINILNTAEFGVIPQYTSLAGYNVFMRPSETLTANPLFAETYRNKIGVDCTLIKLFPDYRGVMDIVSYYADMMSLAAELVGSNLVNSKLSYIIFADNKAMAETGKEIFDRVASGEPAVVTAKKMIDPQSGEPCWQPFTQDLRSNFIAPDTFDCIRSLLNNFDSEIGIPNANVDKKAQIGRAEIASNDVETYTLAWGMFDSIKDGISRAKQMFPGRCDELSIVWRYAPDGFTADGERKKEVDNSGVSAVDQRYRTV